MCQAVPCAGGPLGGTRAGAGTDFRAGRPASRLLTHVTVRNRLASLCAVVALLAAIATSPNFTVEDGPQVEAFAGDFINEYAGAWMAGHGDWQRFYDLGYARMVQHDPARMGIVWNEALWIPVNYPPFYYAALTPLTRLPFRVAALVFIAIMAACFAVALWLLLRSAPDRRRFLPWILVACGCFGPLWESLLSAQKGTLLLLILTGTWLLYDRGQRAAAGIVFGLIAFKPQLVPVIAIAMLLRREWAFLAGLSITGSVAIAVSLGIGVDVCRQYVAVAATAGRFLDSPGFPLALLHCWYGYFRVLFPDTGLLIPQIATVVAVVGTVALLVPLCRKHDVETAAERALAFSGLVVATILVSFHLNEYDLTMLLLPGWLLGNLLSNAHPTTVPYRRALVGLLCLTFVLSTASSRLVLSLGLQLNVPVLAGLLLVMARAQASHRAGQYVVSSRSAAQMSPRGARDIQEPRHSPTALLLQQMDDPRQTVRDRHAARGRAAALYRLL